MTNIAYRASEEGLKKLQSMDEAFTKLKQVTGVKNVEEMHEKFSNQKSNKLQLELEVKDAEHRLAAAKKAHAKQEALFQELKSSGSGMTELNRESINKYVRPAVSLCPQVRSPCPYPSLVPQTGGSLRRGPQRPKVHPRGLGAHRVGAGKCRALLVVFGAAIPTFLYLVCCVLSWGSTKAPRACCRGCSRTTPWQRAACSN
jgi:hypothetical protein